MPHFLLMTVELDVNANESKRIGIIAIGTFIVDNGDSFIVDKDDSSILFKFNSSSNKDRKIRIRMPIDRRSLLEMPSKSKDVLLTKLFIHLTQTSKCFVYV